MAALVDNEGKSLTTIGVVGLNLRSLERTGQLRRFTDYYLRHYASRFDTVYVFSPAPAQTTSSFDGQCIVIEPRLKLPSLLYQWLLPFVHPQLRWCDLLRVMHMIGSPPAIIAKLLWGIPFVATYGYDYASFVWMSRRAKALLALKYLYVKVIVALGVRLASRIIATAPESRQQLAQVRDSREIAYLPNGVDTSAFACSAGHRVKDTQVRCVFVGRLEPQKNLFALIDALSLVGDVSLSLTLVGDGSLLAELTDYARAKQVEASFLGVQPHEELPSILCQHDVFVLPSLEEGHPKALIEAMSCGLACVGTNVRGIAALLVHERTGLLCDVSPESLADALKRISTDSALRYHLGRAARVFAEQHFDLDSLLAQETAMLANGVVRAAEG